MASWLIWLIVFLLCFGDGKVGGGIYNPGGAMPVMMVKSTGRNTFY